ncbi:MAG: DNA-3-methyladenine glycosylase 2 family protein [Verrucomicrobiota bacterium]|nr:DNA-3-methyladenine glycosylase 2 family protein [Verrucomicrobiota bacterium]
MDAVEEAQLAAQCPILEKLIVRHGPIRLELEKQFSPFEALLSSIAHQQLNGKAAATILGRFKDLFGGQYPMPDAVAGVTDEQLRAVGFSRAKVAAIRDLATKAASGKVPTARKISKMSDAEIITTLTEIRGIGQWTVEMLLIFRLGRPDVWPVDDFGVQSGVKLALDLAEHPNKKAMHLLGERWKPHRSTAALYFWRVLDSSREKVGK